MPTRKKPTKRSNETTVMVPTGEQQQVQFVVQSSPEQQSPTKQPPKKKATKRPTVEGFEDYPITGKAYKPPASTRGCFVNRCPDCPWSFEKKAHLTRHSVAHRVCGIFLCQLCSAPMKYTYNIYNHWRQTCPVIKNSVHLRIQIPENVKNSVEAIKTVVYTIMLHQNRGHEFSLHGGIIFIMNDKFVGDCIDRIAYITEQVCPICGLVMSVLYKEDHCNVHLMKIRIDEPIKQVYFCHLCAQHYSSKEDLFTHWRTVCAQMVAHGSDRNLTDEQLVGFAFLLLQNCIPHPAYVSTNMADWSGRLTFMNDLLNEQRQIMQSDGQLYYYTGQLTPIRKNEGTTLDIFNDCFEIQRLTDYKIPDNEHACTANIFSNYFPHYITTKGSWINIEGPNKIVKRIYIMDGSDLVLNTYEFGPNSTPIIKPNQLVWFNDRLKRQCTGQNCHVHFTSEGRKQAHYEKRHGKKQCMLCQEEFKNQPLLNAHWKNACPFPKYALSKFTQNTWNEDKMHKIIHGIAYVLRVCDRSNLDKCRILIDGLAESVFSEKKDEPAGSVKEIVDAMMNNAENMVPRHITPRKSFPVETYEEAADEVVHVYEKAPVHTNYIIKRVPVRTFYPSPTQKQQNIQQQQVQPRRILRPERTMRTEEETYEIQYHRPQQLQLPTVPFSPPMKRFRIVGNNQTTQNPQVVVRKQAAPVAPTAPKRTVFIIKSDRSNITININRDIFRQKNEKLHKELLEKKPEYGWTPVEQRRDVIEAVLPPGLNITLREQKGYREPVVSTTEPAERRPPVIESAKRHGEVPVSDKYYPSLDVIFEESEEENYYALSPEMDTSTIKDADDTFCQVVPFNEFFENSRPTLTPRDKLAIEGVRVETKTIEEAIEAKKNRPFLDISHFYDGRCNAVAYLANGQKVHGGFEARDLDEFQMLTRSKLTHWPGQGDYFDVYFNGITVQCFVLYVADQFGKSRFILYPTTEMKNLRDGGSFVNLYVSPPVMEHRSVPICARQPIE